MSTELSTTEQLRQEATEKYPYNGGNERYRLAQISAYIAGATRQGWVSVEEKLPELGSAVLTFPHFKVLPFGRANEELIHDGIDDDFWEWCGDDEYGMVKLATPYPTHWFPLPSPPSEQQKDIPSQQNKKD